MVIEELLTAVHLGEESLGGGKGGSRDGERW